MVEPPDDFEEAWARIVEDLTRPDPDPGTDADTDIAPAIDQRSDVNLASRSGSDASAPADGSDPSDSRPASGQRAPSDPRAMSDPRTQSDPSAASDTPSGSPVDPGLASLFEPLRRQQPAPDAFLGNWEDEGHFVPPDPPEIPVGTPLKRLAWAGALGGPAVLILNTLTGWNAPGVVTLGAGLAFLAGFATLVWNLPESREDGWDDGARL